ncbi:type I restriction enzyme HsdR N-terminal domain-containing protein [Moorena sp. SIO3H5]|uniref:type I restriction endonuclease n=1 Tax=Moorena sp. SIO3H5 TaxID=2607834 RepID=UPI0013B5C1F4|nr:type I restriction enzyme HsdR N-terminal domain-containing protein [Moorena sp. SIO3H5]NEO71291.1 type I restriction endonuclease subunit R [Moorena sp. SIO3H5]
MSRLLAIEKTISSFQVLHERLGLSRATDESFFSEWQVSSIEILDDDKSFLDRLRQRYYYYYNAGLLTEGTVLLSIVAPLLERLEFHEPPFFVQSEVPISLEVEEHNEVYRGRIDVLVIRGLVWILTVEAKRSKFAADIALPQCLAYMSAAPRQPSFGMVTNGSDFIFCKLKDKVYDFSDAFSLLSRQNKLYEVATILKKLKTNKFSDN